MAFFDFHVHPALKSFFSEDSPTTQKLSPWVRISKDSIPPVMRWCTEFPYIIQTQANLSQLLVNDLNLVCVALYIPERMFLDNDLIEAGTRSRMRVFLQRHKVDTILQGNPYELLVTDDLETLLHPEKFGVTDRKIKPIFKATDYQAGDDKTLHLVFTLEGCHVLSNQLGIYNKDQILQNLEDLRKRVSLLSINLTHIEQSPICNHAFGMQFINDDAFKPTGNGISPDGVDIIRSCYEHNIMVDIKHMSLSARLQLYRLRSRGTLGANLPPIVATHVGFTGLSVNQIPDYVYDYERPSRKQYTRLWQGKPVLYGGQSPRPAFNASSINLYDDDILQILQSGGMIGLSLDKRILGYQEYDKQADEPYCLEEEYVSYAEENLFLPARSGASIGRAFPDDRCMTWQEIYEAPEVTPALSDYHLEYFMAHVLHLIRVAQQNNYDVMEALKQVCIGSDMDGMINPITTCLTYDDIYYLKQDFVAQFVSFAADSDVALPAGFEINQFANQLFHENGKNFVLNRLSLLNP